MADEFRDPEIHPWGHSRRHLPPRRAKESPYPHAEEVLVYSDTDPALPCCKQELQTSGSVALGNVY